MPTVVQSCRIEESHATLLSRQAKRRHLEVSTLSSRDSISGREAYLVGHRVGVWEVLEVYRESKTVVQTAQYFRWPPALVRCALAFAKTFAVEVERQRQAEIGT